MAFDAAERNGRFGRIQCQRGKESSSRGKRKTRVFLCRRTVRVNVGGKAIPTSFLKIEGRGTLIGAKDRRERDRVELVGGQNQGPVAPPMSKRGGGKGDVRREVTARGVMEKGGCVSVIDGVEVGGDDPVEYFLPTGVGSTS